MRVECSYCHRGYEKPGFEDTEGVSHSFCPKCMCCFYYSDLARSESKDLAQLLQDEPKLVSNLKDAIKRDIQAGSLWQKEPFNLNIPPDIELLYKMYERQAKREYEREEKGPDRR